MEFKDIDIEDLNNIKKYIKKENILCDFNPVIIYIWKNFFNTKIAYHNDAIIIKLNNNYLPPLTNKNNYTDLLNDIIIDAKKNNSNFIIESVDEYYLKLDTTNKIKYEEYRKFSNYIYKLSDFISYEGKKFKSKRNLLNQFQKKYENYNVRKITKDDFIILKQFYKKWILNYQSEITSMLEKEYSAFENLFVNFDKLNANGIILEYNNEIFAFSLGTVFNNCFYEHFEKGIPEINGCYQTINHELAKMFSDVEYLNKEDDLGIEGLRKSKLSYNPIKIEKYYVGMIDDQENR